MKMRKLWIVLLTLAMIFTLAACGSGGDDSSEDPAEPSASGGELMILSGKMRLDSMVEGWNNVIAEFEEANDATVTTQFQGEWRDVVQYLAQARMAGDKVDFVRTTGGVIRSTLAPSGALMDMTSLVEPIADRFVDGALDNYKVGGHVWGIPYGETATACVYYNKTMFDELGIAEPKTFDDLVEAAEIIKQETGLRNVWIHQGKQNDYWPMWFDQTYAQYSGNKSVENVEAWLSGEISFENDEVIASLGAIRSFFEEGILTNDSMDTDETAMKTVFAQQQAAMMYGGTWEYVPTLEIVDGAFEIGVFMWPEMFEGAHAQAPGAADDGIAIASNCHLDNFELVAAFLDHMTTPESVERTVGPIGAIIPVFKSMEPADLPCAEELKDEFMPDTIIYLDWMWTEEINSVVGSQIGGVAAGYISPEDAAKAIQNVYEQVVREKDYEYDWYNSWTAEQWEAVTPPVK